MQTPVLFLLASCALLLVGCAGKPKDLILGKWEYIEGGDRKGQKIEFTNDGVVKLEVHWMGPIGKPAAPSGPVTEKGEYKFTDDDNLEIDVPGIQWIKAKVRVTKDELTMTDAQGNTRKLKKVPRFPVDRESPEPK
jgi:hypothetical protein